MDSSPAAETNTKNTTPETTESPGGNLILFWILIIPLGINLWKLFAHEYTMHEFLNGLIFDLAIFTVIIAAVLVNPLRFPVVYYGVFFLFSAAYFFTNKPGDIWDLLLTLAILAVVFIMLPHVKDLLPLVVTGIIIGVIITQVYLPIHYKNSAAKDLEKNVYRFTGERFITRLANFKNFTRAKKQARYYLDMKDWSSTDRKKLAELHKNIYKQLKEYHGTLLILDTLPARTTFIDDTTLQLDYHGKAKMILSDEKYIQPGMIRTSTYEFKRLPMIEIEFEPFSMTLKKQQNGTFLIKGIPQNITWKIIRQHETNETGKSGDNTP